MTSASNPAGILIRTLSTYGWSPSLRVVQQVLAGITSTSCLTAGRAGEEDSCQDVTDTSSRPPGFQEETKSESWLISVFHSKLLNSFWQGGKGEKIFCNVTLERLLRLFVFFLCTQIFHIIRFAYLQNSLFKSDRVFVVLEMGEDDWLILCSWRLCKQVGNNGRWMSRLISTFEIASFEHNEMFLFISCYGSKI